MKSDLVLQLWLFCAPCKMSEKLDLLDSHPVLQPTAYLKSVETYAEASERKINSFFKGLDGEIYKNKNKELCLNSCGWGWHDGCFANTFQSWTVRMQTSYLRIPKTRVYGKKFSDTTIIPRGKGEKLVSYKIFQKEPEVLTQAAFWLLPGSWGGEARGVYETIW